MGKGCRGQKSRQPAGGKSSFSPNALGEIAISESVVMVFSKHIRLLRSCTLAWVAFAIIGWSSYYQAWSFKNLLYYCIAIYFGLGVAIYRMILRYEGNKLVRSFWVAFYIAIPLMIYDYIYITFLRMEPFDLLNRFWFLSVFYIIPWIQALILYLYIAYKKNIKGVHWMLLGITFFMFAVFFKSQWATFEGSFFDTMSDYPERNMTMLGSALRYAIYGSAFSASILSFGRFATGFVREQR